MLTVVMLVFSGCNDSKVKADKTLTVVRDSMPLMRARDVLTLISDSGVTQYRVAAPEWVVFDKKERPCWIFPHGLHLEKFYTQMTVTAEVDADSAIYYNSEEIWILTGNVNAVNEKGEHFESEKLVLEQNNDRIHTDTKVKITQKDKIINGIGLESNQRLSKYTILKPTGIIPLDAEEDEENAGIPADSSKEGD